MKIKDLLELDPELEIIISSDAEGNSFSKLDAFEEVSYEDCGSGEIEIDDVEILEHNAVILWPQ